MLAVIDEQTFAKYDSHIFEVVFFQIKEKIIN